MSPNVKTVVLPTLVLVLIIEIVATTLIPDGRKAMYDTLETKDINAFVTGIMYFSAILLALGCAQGLKRYFGVKTAFSARRGLCEGMTEEWLKNNFIGKIKTPDGKIAEDTKICTDLFVTIVLEIFISASICIGMLYVMVDNPILLIGSLIYTALTAAIAYFFKSPMINANNELQSTEQRYRRGLAETDLGKTKDLVSRLDNVMDAVFRLNRIDLWYALMFSLKNRLSMVIPYAIMVPMYFYGDYTLGDVLKGVAEFNLLVINATIVMTLYPQVTKAAASWKRVIKFYRKVNISE